MDGFIQYKNVLMADENDRFDRGRRSDPAGQSGSFAGHYLQARARYWIFPKSGRLDFSGAALFEGEFLADAPHATGKDPSSIRPQAGGRQSAVSRRFSMGPSMASQPPAKAESVTHVSGTICHPCLEPLKLTHR